jgi:GlcNAc-P-P-Und epimerase
MRILITGGSGFIGTNLVQHYIDIGADVLNIDVAPPRNQQHKHLWCEQDILDQAGLIEHVHRFDPHFVFHFAARTDLNGREVLDYKANTIGVENIINSVKKLPNLDRVIFASSMLVCKLGYMPESDTDYNPINPYGESKVVGERIVREEAAEKFDWVIVRPTSIWGPWFSTPYKHFFDAVKEGMYFHPQGKTIHRTYGFVLNAVYQLSKLADKNSTDISSKTFYLADYEPLNLLTWSAMIQKQFGSKRIREVPLFLLQVGAMAGEILKILGYSNPPLTCGRLKNLLTDAVYDLSETKRVCGKLPYETLRGVDLTVEWMLKN